MAMDDAVTLPLGGENSTRSTELPEGWVERALAQASRLGRPVAPDPDVPAAKPQAHGGEVVYREEAGLRVHPSWPPGYFEWLRAAQESGELEIGDPEELRRAFEDPQPE